MIVVGEFVLNYIKLKDRQPELLLKNTDMTETAASMTQVCLTIASPGLAIMK